MAVQMDRVALIVKLPTRMRTRRSCRTIIESMPGKDPAVEGEEVEVSIVMIFGVALPGSMS